MSSPNLTKSRVPSAPAAPEIFVAAFGKHIAWDDFIDDPGLETERLIGIKRVLYLEGIAPAIEAGSWDRLDVSQRTEGFAHLIVWFSRAEIIVCRLWPSSDAKGRIKYPMVAVAQCKGVSLSWVLVEALPRLERLERRCREATTQDQVRAALDATRAELRARAAVAEADDVLESTAVAEIAEALSAEGSRDPFYRLMYQIERDWGAFLIPRPDAVASSRAWSGDIRPQHARVPSLVGSVSEAISRWSLFVFDLVVSATSVTLIRSTDPDSRAAAWTDIIVGEPEGGQFFCLRASDQSLPLATSIPYTIDAEFKARCEHLVEDSRAGRLGPGATEIVSVRQSGLLHRVQGLLSGKRRVLIAILIAVGLVGAGIAIVMFFSGFPWSGGKGERTRAAGQGEPHPPVPAGAAAARLPAAAAGEWGRFCDAYHNWFGEFVVRLQKRPGGTAGSVYKTRAEFYGTDPYLKGLIERLDGIQSAGRAIDPWSIAGVPKSQDLADMAKSPPAAVAEPASAAHIEGVLAIIDGFSARLASDWPALGELTDAAASLDSSGFKAEATFLRTLASEVRAAQAGGAAQGIDEVLSALGVVTELQRRLAVRDDAVALARSTGDALLGRFADWASKATPVGASGDVDLASLEDLSRSLSRVMEVAAPLRQFLAEQWSGTDAPLLRRRAASNPAITAEPPTRESFMAWLELARETPRLDPALDPRPGAGAVELFREAQESRRRLEVEFKVAPEKRLTDLEATAQHAFADLTALPFNAETQQVIVEGLARVELEVRELKQGLDNAVAVEGERRAGSSREIRECLVVQETIVVSSEAINAAWRAGRDKLLSSTPDRDFAQLRSDADALRNALLELDGAIEPELQAAGAGAVSRAVATASWTARERVIASVLKEWGGLASDPSGKVLAGAGQVAARDFARQRAELAAMERDLEKMRLRIAAGASLSEKTSGGEPLASVVERCRRSDLLRDAGVTAALRPLMEEVESLEHVESLVGALELVQAAEDALPARLTAALAAWRRLGRLTSPAWPDSWSALEREAALSTRLLEAIAVRAGAPRAELEAEIRAQRAARWSCAFAVLSDPVEIEAASAMAEEMSVDPATLPVPLRYNLILATLRRSAQAGTLGDEQARQHAREFEGQVMEMGEAVAALPGVTQLMGRLGTISGRVAVETPAIDVTRLGPGALAGFKSKLEGTTLRFTHGEGVNAIILEFVRVDVLGVETFYLGAAEVSLGQWIHLVDMAGAWKEVALLFTATDQGEDFRKGPRVWRWAERERRGGGEPVMRPAEKWLRELATGRDVPETPRTINAGTPGLSHPMNYVPPSAALLVAQLAGCRLPTVKEWRAAAAMGEAAKQLQQCNLRDAQWKSEQAYINELARTGSVNWPDDDIFLPAGPGPRMVTGPTATSNPWDDGVLWLAPVDSPVGAGGSGRFIHLVGNVAEYVVDAAPTAFLAAAGGPSAAEAKALLLRQRDALRVIGASALSPLEMAPTEAQPLDLDDAVGGFGDVGFRLAFSGGAAGPAVERFGAQLAKALGEATYILPGGSK